MDEQKKKEGYIRCIFKYGYNINLITVIVKSFSNKYRLLMKDTDTIKILKKKLEPLLKIKSIRMSIEWDGDELTNNKIIGNIDPELEEDEELNLKVYLQELLPPAIALQPSKGIDINKLKFIKEFQIHCNDWAQKIQHIPNINIEIDENVLLHVDWLNDEILVYNSNGAFIRILKREDNSNSHIWPVGVINSKGNIIVSDTPENSIAIYRPDGDLIKSFEIPGTRPKGVAIDREDNIIVVAEHTDRIQIFSPNGDFIREFGSSGENPGQFYFPQGIAIDREDNIIVVDEGNDRIQIFSHNGNFIREFGSEGENPGQFYFPHGVAVDRKDNIYVVDRYSIQIFSHNGDFIKKIMIEKKRSSSGFFVDFEPTDIVIDKKGNIIIINTYGEVQVYGN